MKPVLVGLSNPYSRDPDNALAPYPDRSSGHRLWRTMTDVDISCLSGAAFNASAHQSVYMGAFRRLNLFSTTELTSNPHVRRSAALRLLHSLPADAVVLLLGAEVRQCVGSVLSRIIKPILIHPQVIDGITWRCLPHPSGRSTSYNHPVVRMLVGMVLADCLTENKESNRCREAELARP